MKNFRTLIIFSFSVILLLSACNLPQKEEEGGADGGDPIKTAAAQTVAAALTRDAPATQDNTPVPTSTAVILTTATSASAVVQTNTVVPQKSPTSSVSCDAASYVADITIPDDTVMQPGENFTKTWEIKNVGTCTWTSAYSLIYAADISGTATLGEPSSVNLTDSVAPGETIKISVDLTAPATAGTYRSDWLMRNASGISFNIDIRSIWLQIKVANAAPTNTPTITVTPGGPTVTPAPPTATATKAPTVYTSASSQSIAQTNSMDFDSGNATTAGADIVFEYAADDNKNVTPQNGAKILLWGFGEPSNVNCANAVLSTNSIKVDTNLPGQYVCYQTDSGRLGFFYVKSLSPDDVTQVQVLDFSFTTWDIP